MASIRINRVIKNQIKNKGIMLFNARIVKKEGSLRPDFYDDVATAFVTKYVMPHQVNRTFPDHWMATCKYLTVHFTTGSQFSKSLTKRYVILRLNHLVTSESLTLTQGDVDPDLLNEYQNYYDSVQLLKQERDKFTVELNRVLDNCNTITQFLKIWPQGEHLIDNIDLSIPKRTRKKRETIIDKSTLDTLNVGLLKQTMLNK